MLESARVSVNLQVQGKDYQSENLTCPPFPHANQHLKIEKRITHGRFFMFVLPFSRIVVASPVPSTKSAK